MSGVFVVILAGGGGERFWPLSCAQRPKQFLRLFGDRTMLQETFHRVAGLAAPECVYVVTGREYSGLVRQQLPQVPADNVLEEPCGRDTAAAVGLAAKHVLRRHPQSVMVVLPADHYIADVARFREAVGAAVEAAREGEWLVTFGVVPTRPETGYGYIRRGAPVWKIGGLPVFRALGFTEKPDRERASAFLAAGEYYWNSGMFAWRVDLIDRLLRTYLPELAAGLEEIAAALGTARLGEVLEQTYPALPKISLDYGVMEKASNVLVIPMDAGWDDVGTWPAWGRYNPADERGNVLEGRGVLLDTEGCIVRAAGHVVATLGVRDLVIVEEGGRLLVCAKDRAQEVKRLVAALRQAGYDDAV